MLDRFRRTQTEAAEERPEMVMEGTERQIIDGTPRARQTTCPRCGGQEIDDIMYRGAERAEFHPNTGILKPEGERPAEVLIGQICRSYVPVTEEMEEPCGYKLWHTPVYTPARGRRRRRTPE